MFSTWTRICSSAAWNATSGLTVAAFFAALAISSAAYAQDPTLDTDGDGIIDSIDVCPFDTSPGQIDADGDGCNDCDASLDTDSDGFTDCVDDDDDGDGVLDVLDSAPLISIICQDSDGDGCDDCTNGQVMPAEDGPDADGDGICDTSDICIGDDSTGDADGDGFCDDVDNCRLTANPDQADDDGNQIGNVCEDCDENLDTDGDAIQDCEDPDDDNDGVDDVDDIAPLIPNICQDSDGDGCDDCTNGQVNPANDGPDADGDGACDAGDICPNDPDDDADGDGVCGDIDNCPSAANPDQTDSDGNGLGDACDNASLSLIKTADYSEFDENVSSVSYTYTVENTGGVSLSDIWVSDDKVASVSCPTTVLGAGEQIECTGTYQIMPVDILTGKITNTATAYGTDQQTDDVASGPASVTVIYIGQSVEEAVEEATGSFILRRMDRLLADGPDRARLLRKRADRGYSSGSPVDFTASGGSGGGMNVNLSTSLQQSMAYSANSMAMLGSGGSGADLGAAYGGVPPAAFNDTGSPYDLWIEGRFTTYDSDDGDGSFGVAYLGADWLANDRLLVGLLAQFDWMSQDEGSASDVDGFGWMVGPYVSAEIVNNVFFDARLAWGQSDNDVTVNLSGIPFNGDFDTERWLARANLSGNYTRGNWRLTPEISVAYIQEKRKTFGVSADGEATTTIDSETFELGRLTAGPEFAYRFFHGPLTIEPQFAMRFIWDFLAQGDEISGMPIYDTSPRGAVELGLGMHGESGVSARISGKYDGIGTGGALDAFSLNGWLNIPLQ